MKQQKEHRIVVTIICHYNIGGQHMRPIRAYAAKPPNHPDYAHGDVIEDYLELSNPEYFRALHTAGEIILGGKTGPRVRRGPAPGKYVSRIRKSGRVTVRYWNVTATLNPTRKP